MKHSSGAMVHGATTKIYNYRISYYFMGKILGAFLIIVLLIAIGFLSYIIYLNYPGELQKFNITNNPTQLPYIPAPSEIKQFYPNMRFNHNNISYNFGASCGEDKIKGMEQAFFIIQSETGIISFSKETNPDISISCSPAEIQKGENTFVAGEGGPRQFVNSTEYPIIISGEIELLGQGLGCKTPIVELHELLHVFGFDHLNDSRYIMYPYADCSQKLNPDYIQYLKELYSIKPLPDLYFDYANVSKSGRYLNFDVVVNNGGMIDEPNATLRVSADNSSVEIFSLGPIGFGGGIRFSIQNLRLPGRNTREIEFYVSGKDEELNYNNDFLNAGLG
jgi:hypothetical protein